MVFGHCRIVSSASYSSIPSLSSLCISLASFTSSAQPVKNAMAKGIVKVSNACQPTVSTPNCLSFSSSNRHSCVPIQLPRPYYLSHIDEQQLRKKVRETLSGKAGGVKCWRVVRMDRRLLQFMAGSRPNTSNTRPSALQATLSVSCICPLYLYQ